MFIEDYGPEAVKIGPRVLSNILPCIVYMHIAYSTQDLGAGRKSDKLIRRLHGSRVEIYIIDRLCQQFGGFYFISSFASSPIVSAVVGF